MRKLILIIFFILYSGTAFSEDIYVAQTAAGGDTGTDCTNTHSAAWFNTAGNWGGGAGRIDAGDTVHLCGTITTALTAQGSGSLESPVTIFFETGANITAACGSTGCLNVDNLSYITVDGGSTCGWVNQAKVACNGTVQSSIARPASSQVGIKADSCANCEFKNLNIGPIYQAVAYTYYPDGDIRGIQNATGNVAGVTWKVHNNILTHSSSSIVYIPTGDNDNGIQIYNNSIENINSSVDISNNNNGTLTAALIHDNHFGSTANWDYESCPDHHNSLHAFSYVQTASGIKYYNNIVDGNWGTCLTAALYFEGNDSYIDNVEVFNNVFRITQDISVSAGIISMTVGGTSLFSNNTVIGTGNDTCVWIDGNADASITVENNIMDGCAQSFITRTISLIDTIDHNLYSEIRAEPWATCPSDLCTYYTTLVDWQTASGGESHSLADAGVNYARLNADGSLQSNSPARDIGGSMSAIYTTDILGLSRPQGAAWDSGAYEYGTSSTPGNFRGVITSGVTMH